MYEGFASGHVAQDGHYRHNGPTSPGAQPDRLGQGAADASVFLHMKEMF